MAKKRKAQVFVANSQFVAKYPWNSPWLWALLSRIWIGWRTALVIVQDDGSVGEVVVIRSLDSELDQQAVIALKQWEFTPGTREGKPVQVRIHCEPDVYTSKVDPEFHCSCCSNSG